MIFKNDVRKAKRDSWRLFTESMNSRSATARLAKIMRRNETVQVSNVLRPNGEFTKSSVETMNCLLDTLAPGSREVNYSKAAEPSDNTAVLSKHDEIVSSICSLEKMERAINEFLPFTTLGQTVFTWCYCKKAGIVLEIYTKPFSKCARSAAMCRKYRRKGLVSSSLNPVKKTIVKLSLSG